MAAGTVGILKNVISRVTGRLHGATRPVAPAITTTPARLQPPPAPVVHKVIGQLQDQKAKVPLAGFTVRIFELDADQPTQSLGYDITDAHGLFTMAYATPAQQAAAGGEPAERRLRLQILDRQSRQIARIDLAIKPEQKPPLVIPVDVPEQPAPPSPTIEGLVSKLELSVPQELVTFLDNTKIQTLDDLRKTGGLANLDGLPLGPDAPIVKTLDAHANLSVLSPDIVLNHRLIAKGFDSITTISRSTRQTFVRGMFEELGDFGAAQLQATAVAQTGFLQNVDAGVRANLANGVPISIKIPDPGKLYPPKCACANCDAAVSPLAYLADLLDYTLKHLDNNTQPITLAFLTNTFFQQFGDLPADCEEMDRQERQVRLCIEVLRRYLAANPPTVARQQTLDAAEKAYREAVYTALLLRFGASYSDIRLARTASGTVRQRLADRLGIDVVVGQNHLDALFLNPRAPAGDPLEITEPTLERLLGFVDTVRGPLSGGAKQGDQQNQLSRWNFTGVTWNRNTDADGFIYLRITGAAGGCNIEVFRDTGRAQASLVAHGSMQTRAGPVNLEQDNGSSLSGRILVNYRADNAAIAINAIPNLLSWRLAHLRMLWRQQDWPVDRYQDSFLPAEDREPFIDPDVIGPDDFRTPFAKAHLGDRDAAFDLWLRRRDWVDASLQAFADMNLADGTPNFAKIINSMYDAVDYGGARRAAWANATREADLEPLRGNLAQGQDVDATRRRIRTDLKMSVDGFTRLMALRQKDQDAKTDPRNAKVSSAEWREVYSILTQAYKTVFLAEWRAEEGPLVFGPTAFWPALREPQQGDWPAAILLQHPLIDPEAMSVTELSTTKPGNAAVRLWERRRALLDQIQADIKNAREVHGVDAMVSQAVGDPRPGDPLPRDLGQLIADLGSADAARKANAANLIETRLFLTLDAFNWLAQIRIRVAGGQQITAEQWAAAYALLTTARKLKQLYAGWKQEEIQLPLIDPEDLKQPDLPELTVGARALALWRSRGAELGRIRQDLLAAREANGFDAMLGRALGEPNPGDPLPHNLDLDALNTDLASGDTARTSQAHVQITGDLYMTVEAFGRLLAVKARYDDPSALRQPTAAEWADAYAILTSAQKEKRAYPTWLRQEQDGITGVKYWAGLKAELPLWRASAERRGIWRQALQVRSQAPLIDPDLIGPGDLRDPTSGPVFRRWAARNVAITLWLAELRHIHDHAPGAPDLRVFDAILARSLFDDAAAAITLARLQTVREAKGLGFVLLQLLGDPLPDLAALAASLAGNAIDARLKIAENLYLTIEGFQRLMEIRARDTAGQAVTPAQWDEVDQILTLSALVRAAMLPSEAQQKGEDITNRLGQLSLTSAAFSYLARVRDAAARQAPLLSSEWEDVYSILVQVRKRRAFAEWRNEETPSIIRGPDQFRIPDPPPLQFPPVPPPSLPAWRALNSDRQDWQDNLQARIDQETTILAAYQDALSATEADVLPGLRNALIMAIDPPTNPPLAGLQDKSRWITNHLLIDAEADGCQQTTRVSQAVETVQGILWSVRTGLLQQVYPQLSLDADEFDAEWSWIGSYATWRAAMFVFLYPENLLIPGLRRHQTPAFSQLVANLRANRSLGPEQACEAAKTYSDYFHDIATLSVEATCQTRTRVSHGACKDRTQDLDRDLFFMFARGGTTGAVYWSAYDPAEPSGYAQTFWAPVPGLSGVVNIVGAVPYEQSPEQRFLFLFVRIEEKGQQKLNFVKYNLIQQAWDTTPGELNVPNKETAFTAVVKQSSREDQPPHLAIRLTSGALYERHLNAEGSDWENIAQGGTTRSDDDWKPLVGFMTSQFYGFTQLCAMVEAAPDEYYLFVSAGWITFYRLFGIRDDGFWAQVGHEFIGAFAWPGTSDVYVFTGRDVPTYRVITHQVDPYGNTIVPQQYDFSNFHPWLIYVTGVSPTFITITDDGPYFGMNYTNFFFLGETTQAYFDALTHYINWLESGLMQENSPRGEAWRLADEAVRRFSVDGSSLRDVVFYTVRAGGLTVPFNLRFGDRAAVHSPGGSECSDPSNDLAGRVRIAPNCGNAVSPETILFAYHRTEIDGPLGAYRCHFDRAGDDTLTELGTARIAPLVAGTYDIVEQMTGADLQIRRRAVQMAFAPNLSEPTSNLAYLQEAYYFVPVQIALQLQDRGHYEAALDWFRTVYDYTVPDDQRKIYYGLTLEHFLSTAYTRLPDWLLDPLNPHQIAERRADTYTRFTVLSLIRCFLDYADAEFTNDTAESVPRARQLYLTALDLLNTAELQQRSNGCDQLIGTLEIDVGGPEWIPIIARIQHIVANIGDVATLRTTVDAISGALRAGDAPEARLQQGLGLAIAALAKLPAPPSYGDMLKAKPSAMARVSQALLADPSVAQATATAGAAASQDFLHSVASVTGMPETALVKDRPALPWLRNGKANLEPANGGLVLADGGLGQRLARLDPLDTLLHVKGGGSGFYAPAPSNDFCIPPNPVLQALHLRAELNLYKLRTCRNIAGVKRQLDPYTAPTDTTSGLPQIGPGGTLQLPGALTLRPTTYRYRVLIDRAKQLVQLAAQIEAAMLAALEKRDAEYYAQLKARQDVHLTQAGVRLHDLRIREAQDGVTLAQLQRQRAQIQLDHYQQLLDEGLSSLEKDALSLLGTGAGLQVAASLLEFAAAVTYYNVAMTSFMDPTAAGNAQAAALSATGGGLSTLAGSLSTRASILSTRASYERRQQEWDFQRGLAQQDVRIGAQQVTIADDQVRVAGQERVIAQMQADNAKETLDFLSNKFTNVELYDWMSNVLGGVYSFFLQQATAMARLAENQLAFERQTTPPAFVQADYWDAPGDFAGGGSESAQPPDRRGLTGSARLLQDIEQIDQYAFDTDQRKLQLTKTLSLARLAPAEFQRFRETGVLNFATPMELFDRDFPGHYLRLIKQVRTSVIALIPPTQGIRATLSSTGISRVTIGGDVFQTEVVRHDPETVAFTSPQNATGLFNLDAQSDMLLPFEGLGVDARWELRMPKPANLFDYTTIADVLVSFDYTALNSFDYRQQVIQNLDRPLSADLPFNFRNQLADAWYDLHNPDQSATPMVVRFPTTRDNFPPNLDNLRIQQLVLYFAQKPGSTFEVDVTSLRFTEEGGGGPVGGEANSIDGVISTRTGNAGSWTPILGKSPFGEFELTLPDNPETRRLFSDDQVQDILFVITYTGRPSEWPA